MTSRIVPSICCLQFVFDEMAMSVLVVPEQRQQNDDRKGNAQQPQQQTASQAHCHLHQQKIDIGQITSVSWSGFHLNHVFAKRATVGSERCCRACVISCKQDKEADMKKAAIGAVAAIGLAICLTAPASAQVGVYAGPGGFGVEFGGPYAYPYPYGYPYAYGGPGWYGHGHYWHHGGAHYAYHHR